MNMGLHGRPGVDQVCGHTARGDAGGHLPQREHLWPRGSSEARERAENTAAKHKPVSTGIVDFFRGCNTDKASNRPQGDSSGKLQMPAKRASGD